MAKQPRHLIALRGTPEWERALHRLLKTVQAHGQPGVTSLHQLADLALVELGVRHGMKLPRRARPLGVNQHGEPRAPDP